MAFKFNPFTGTLDIVEPNDPKFSYLAILTGESVLIPVGQQMLFDGHLLIDGTLEVDGEVNQIVDYTFWAYSWNLIPADVSLLVPVNRDMLVEQGLRVEGRLTIDGRLVEV